MGVELAGDIPFMVATDSADVWSRRQDFRLDARVGVPPDAFSATGQDWGLPVYRWADMEAGGHAWMTARADRMADLYGLYRVDHVVGLYRTYYFPNDGSPAAFVPADEPAQIANGERMMALFSRRARVIAEDLGVVPDFIRTSLDRLAIPGYRVQRWERDWKLPGQPFRDPATWPAGLGGHHRHPRHRLAGRLVRLARRRRSARAAGPPRRWPRSATRAPARFDDSVRDALLELLYGSGSDLLLLPFQDLFGHRERVNVPGTVNDQNWTYRMPTTLSRLHRRPRLAPPAAEPRRAPRRGRPALRSRHAGAASTSSVTPGPRRRRRGGDAARGAHARRPRRLPRDGGLAGAAGSR